MGTTILPNGWTTCSISDIAEVNPKKLDASPELISGFIPMSHVPNTYLGQLEYDERPWAEIQKAYTNFKDGDVILAKVTPCFENGKAAIVHNLPNGIGAGSSEFYVLRPYAPFVSKRFIYSIIKSKKFMAEGAFNMTGAVGLRRVPRAFVVNFGVNLPPLAEQKVIADKLDALLAQVETTKAHLERIPTLLKRFRQSVLAAAVSGKLTEGKVFFEKRETTLKQIGKFIGGKTPSKSNKSYWVDGSIPWISPKDMKSDYIENSIDHITDAAISSAGMKVLPSGTILMVTRSGILAHSFPVALAKVEVTINQDIKALIINEKKVLSVFMLYLIKGLEQKILNECSKSGTTVSSVETNLLANLKFNLPPLEEQTEIVRRVEQLFAFADRLQQQTDAALERVNSLTQSILAKAFRGELTAGWRAANPELISGEHSAEALLAKIHAERAATPAKRTRMARGTGNLPAQNV